MHYKLQSKSKQHVEEATKKIRVINEAYGKNVEIALAAATPDNRHDKEEEIKQQQLCQSMK